MLRDKILADLQKAVQDLGYPATDIVLSIPKNSAFGDYTTNSALQLAKLMPQNNKQSPQDIANKILSNLGDLSYLSKVNVAGAGFINFFIKKEFLARDLQEILEKREGFGKSKNYAGKFARVEFVSANPTGPLHIGNARSAPIGDVIANVLAECGYKVVREFLDNDVGEQIKALGATIKAKRAGNVAGDNQYQGSYIDELVKSMEEDLDGKSDEQIGKLAVEQLHQDILADCHSMGVKFDLVVHESELRKQASGVLNELEKTGVVKQKDGALWLAPSDEFLKDRETVIQKSDGSYTYFTSDIVYHKIKFESGADQIIDIFGSNHHGHVPRLKAAVSALGFDPSRLKVVLYQYVRVKRGSDIVKMSKRSGNFITAREVLDEVGKDAFRFYLLRFSPQTHMDFDLELLKQQTKDNPVYYVQYAHARMHNILAKSGTFPGRPQVHSDPDYTQLKDEQEINLIRQLLYFPNLVEELADSLQVHQLTEYAIYIADLFHKFYEHCPVLQAEEKLKEARLALVQAAKITLANTLKLLGVSAPERM